MTARTNLVKHAGSYSADIGSLVVRRGFAEPIRTRTRPPTEMDENSNMEVWKPCIEQPVSGSRVRHDGNTIPVAIQNAALDSLQEGDREDALFTRAMEAFEAVDVIN